jgi:hypothetical protein
MKRAGDTIEKIDETFDGTVLLDIVLDHDSIPNYPSSRQMLGKMMYVSNHIYPRARSAFMLVSPFELQSGDNVEGDLVCMHGQKCAPSSFDSVVNLTLHGAAHVGPGLERFFDCVWVLLCILLILTYTDSQTSSISTR